MWKSSAVRNGIMQPGSVLITAFFNDHHDRNEIEAEKQFFSGFLVHRLWANFIEDNSTKQKLFLLLLTVFFSSPRSPQSNAVLYFAKLLLFSAHCHIIVFAISRQAYIFAFETELNFHALSRTSNFTFSSALRCAMSRHMSRAGAEWKSSVKKKTFTKEKKNIIWNKVTFSMLNLHTLSAWLTLSLCSIDCVVFFFRGHMCWIHDIHTLWWWISESKSLSLCALFSLFFLVGWNIAVVHFCKVYRELSRAELSRYSWHMFKWSTIFGSLSRRSIKYLS